MTDNECPLCGKKTNENEKFCENCQEIAKHSSTTELISGINDTRNPVKEINSDKTISEPTASDSPQKERNSDKQMKEGKTKRTNRKLYTFFFIGLILCIIIGGVGAYAISKQRESEEVENGFWNECVQKNTPLSYSKYLLMYPEGKYSKDALDKIAILKEKERQEWESLRNSNDIDSFNAFLRDNPQTPYVQEIKQIIDSLAWKSTVDQNTLDAYKAYMDNVKLGNYEGAYQTVAEDKIAYLNEIKPLEGDDLKEAKDILTSFFKFLSQKQYEKLSAMMADEITKYFVAENSPKQTIIKKIGDDLKEQKIKTRIYTPDLNSLEGFVDNQSTSFLTIVVDEELIPIEKKSKKEVDRQTLIIELNEKRQIRAVYNKP